jgi:hypothetical protein
MSARPLIASTLLCVAGLVGATAADLPPVPPVADTANLGVGIQRAMMLMATSTPEKRNRVKVLFYGQSITEQAWSKLVGEDLKKRFPHADLEIANKAIGGFASQRLVKIAEHDLYPWYPDLVIFHVYGANDTYEEILKNIRTRTTAEVLLQKDHVGAKLPPVIKNWDEAKELQKQDGGMWWDYMMNHVFLPDYAKKYGLGLADVRTPWVKYLADNKLDTRALLKDDIHLNDHGCFVMAGIVSQYLVHRPDLPKDAWQNLVTEVPARPADKTLTVEAEGNRFDVVVGTIDKPLSATVTIDGRKPSEFPGCYAFTRVSPHAWSPLFIMRVDHNAPLVIEDWTLTLTSVAADGKSWKFAVKGSVTGDDGEGDSSQPFTSKSGRVVIAPDSWFPGGAKIDNGYKITWKAVPLFADKVELKAGGAGKENLVTLAQGLPNGKHTIVLTAEQAIGKAVSAIRVYKPPMK